MYERIGAFSLAALLLASLCACTANAAIDSDKFSSARNEFATVLLVRGPSPQEYGEDVLPNGVTEIEYPSGDLVLKAWISAAPVDGKKHPAVVYVHGGFAFGGSDWEDARPYLDAGFVVMAPMLRGENGNPGSFEFFYGEVDDAIAAGEYLAAQPGVDPDAVFLSGHSTGGTISMLASMLPSPFKAVATFGASPDQKSFFRQWATYAPFDVNNTAEIDIRSPQNHIESIQKPLFIYVGTQDAAYFSKSKSLADNARKIGISCEFIPMEGDHFTTLQPSMEDSIERFLQVE
jgi:dipeptidyl aminopeptidase/acylaminoacyl peptidase